MNVGPLFFYPSAFWLVLPVVAILLIARLYRTRRRELIAGSLLLWRRLAAQQPKMPPRRVIIDKSLLLQLAVLISLIAALAAPTLALGGVRGREVLLVLDNGPLSRARDGSGKPLLSQITTAAEKIISELQPQDRVFVAYSSPSPKVLQGPLSSADALKAVGKVTPALSGPDSGAVWLFCADAARRVQSGGEVRRVVLSLRGGPADVELGSQWQCVAPRGLSLNNVGIVAMGSALIPNGSGVGVELLVRIRNFSTQIADGSVRLEAIETKEGAQQKTLHLEPNAEEAVVFDLPALPKGPIRVTWSRSDGKADALPEDDSLIAVPRPARVARVRFHGPAPAVERLYKELSPPLTIVPDSDTAPVDLEIFNKTVPDSIDPESHAMMLLSPEQGYHSNFEVGGDLKKVPTAQRADDDPLNQFIKDSPESSFLIGKARELIVTGDLKVLMKDSHSGRPLIATFKDERGRPAYVFAFVPGQGQALERPLEPALAVLLMRMADQAAGAGEPFALTRAEALEQKRGEALPLDWSPDAKGGGVLDAGASNLALGNPTTLLSGSDNAWSAVSRSESLELSPWLIVLALALAAWELWRERPSLKRASH